MKDKISWAIPTLVAAIIFVVTYFCSVLLGVTELSFFNFSGNFLLGCVFGYIGWLLFL